MSYLINDKVFVTKEGMRTIGADSTEIYLSATPSRLLFLLIQQNNIVITKEQILADVWEANGLSSSMTSLAQHISKLRKSFREFGIHEEIIRSLPDHKIIFKANVLECSEEHNSQSSDAVNSKKMKEIVFTLLLVVFFILFFFVLCFSIYYATQKNYANWHYLAEYNNCKIYTANEGLTTTQKKNYMELSKYFIEHKNIKCSHSDMILIDHGSYSPVVKPGKAKEPLFFAYCQTVDDVFTCQSEHTYTGIQ